MYILMDRSLSGLAQAYLVMRIRRASRSVCFGGKIAPSPAPLIQLSCLGKIRVTVRAGALANILYVARHRSSLSPHKIQVKSMCSLPEFVHPVFAKTSPNRTFLLIENERFDNFWVCFRENCVFKFGHLSSYACPFLPLNEVFQRSSEAKFLAE
jgi:hypothetical protein